MKSIKCKFANCVKNIFLFTLTMFLFSCEKNSPEEIFVDAYIDFIIKDSEGNDLLNSNNPNAINIDNIKIIYEINGEQVVYYDEFMGAPKGFFLIEEGEYNRIRVFPNIDINSEFPVTYVQWSENDTDKLSYEIIRYDTGSTYISKVWLNDELIWTTSQGERLIELIK